MSTISINASAKKEFFVDFMLRYYSATVKSSQMINCVNEKLMPSISKTVSDSIWYDECSQAITMQKVLVESSPDYVANGGQS
jgi:hypothetical protein